MIARSASSSYFMRRRVVVEEGRRIEQEGSDARMSRSGIRVTGICRSLSFNYLEPYSQRPHQLHLHTIFPSLSLSTLHVPYRLNAFLGRGLLILQDMC